MKYAKYIFTAGFLATIILASQAMDFIVEKPFFKKEGCFLPFITFICPQDTTSHFSVSYFPNIPDETRSPFSEMYGAEAYCDINIINNNNSCIKAQELLLSQKATHYKNSIIKKIVFTDHRERKVHLGQANNDEYIFSDSTLLLDIKDDFVRFFHSQMKTAVKIEKINPSPNKECLNLNLEECLSVQQWLLAGLPKG